MGALVLLLVLTVSFTSVTSDLAGDRAALLSLRAAVSGRTLLWDAAKTDPCQWTGVHCDGNRVTALRLPGVSVSGELPAGIFGNLTELRTLSLRFNALTGELPGDLGKCVGLRNLYLQGNRFSGELPEFLFALENLVRLNLAENNFSGRIPSGINKMTRLKTLYLEKNMFVGSVPDLDIIGPNLGQFNVSFNSLNGSIPKSLESMPVSSFFGTELCGKPLKNDCVDSKNISIDGGNVGKKDDDGGLSGGAIAGIVIGSVVGVLILIVLVFVCCRKKRSKKTSSVDVANVAHVKSREAEDEKMAEIGGGGNGFSVAAAAAAAMMGTGKVDTVNSGANKKLVFFGNVVGRDKMFDLEDLLRASAEVLGKGTFGTAYKAVLEAGIVVAVKRLKDVTISEKEFREKIEAVGAMDHDNLVPLKAYYYSREEKLLVYDYMPMGSLSALLHGNKGSGRTPLNWELRSNIALGAARGIEYLHSQGPNVSHGNIKSSNVLITKTNEARVSDFGLAHLVGASATPNRIAGYRAPEVTDSHKVSQKADVYSFGVLLLELLTGKAPTHALLNEEGVDLPRWVQSIVREEWSSEVFDLELLRYQNVEDEMVQLLQLAIDCAAQFPDQRPTMSEVTRQIEALCRSNVLDDQNPKPDIY
ncbi:putative inactive receptor kinase At1g48480 [Apium graveolens]|uniref:putative inactive receptor kinase At1g48480 n=1 Tax=Apium graveolens TaxID=4045 RepID=UPI003D79FBE4